MGPQIKSSRKGCIYLEDLCPLRGRKKDCILLEAQHLERRVGKAPTCRHSAFVCTKIPILLQTDQPTTQTPTIQKNPICTIGPKTLPYPKPTEYPTQKIPSPSPPLHILNPPNPHPISHRHFTNSTDPSSTDPHSSPSSPSPTYRTSPPHSPSVPQHTTSPPPKPP